MKAINLDEAKKINDFEYDFKGKLIFIKPFSRFELIAEEVANFLNLNPIQYKIGFHNEKKVLFSECFYDNVKEKYITGEDLLTDYFKNLEEIYPGEYLGFHASNNLTDIWAALEYHFADKYPHDIPKVMEDLIKLFCFDLILNITDRHSTNWGIITSENGIRLTPAFDNEFGFFDDKNLLKVDNEQLKSNTELLDQFLSNSSTEYREIFFDMFTKLTVDNFINIIKKVETNRRLRFTDDEFLDFKTQYEHHRLGYRRVLEKHQGRGL